MTCMRFININYVIRKQYSRYRSAYDFEALPAIWKRELCSTTFFHVVGSLVNSQMYKGVGGCHPYLVMFFFQHVLNINRYIKIERRFDDSMS